MSIRELSNPFKAYWHALQLTLEERGRLFASPPPHGNRFFVITLLLTCITGSALYLIDGYHTGFLPLNAFTAPLPGTFWQGITMIGDERFALAIALLFALFYPRVLFALMIAAVIGTLYSRGLKPLFDMARPPAVLEPGSFNLLMPPYHSNSFPSGHTLTAFLLLGVWAYYLASWRTLLMLLALVAGISRVALGIHWPVDLAAGAFGGLLAAWAGVHLAHRWHWGMRPIGHLLLLILPLIAAYLLIVDAGDYTKSAWMRLPVGTVALLTTLIGYLLLPWWKNRRSEEAE
ncbi:MAG: phosphatase PAP2 family protein [Candidatus Sedimenticola sp. (ex Thyasira tokunagai)]